MRVTIPAVDCEHPSTLRADNGPAVRALRWRTVDQTRTQPLIVQQDVPGAVIPPRREVVGRAIAADHAASGLPIDEAGAGPMEPDQGIDILAQQGATTAALRSDKYLALPHRRK